jgi:hypothetical protein
MKLGNQRVDTALMALVSTILLLGSSLAQAQLIEDFDGNSNTAWSLTNSTGAAPSIKAGGPTGNFVRLANLSGGNNNSIAFDENLTVSGPMPFGFQLHFDFRMTDDAANATAGGCCGSAADGLGIGLFGTATYGASGATNPASSPTVWETPNFPDSFTVGLDIFPLVDIVTVHLDGVEVGSADVQAFLDLNNGLFHRAMVTATPSGANALVDLTIIEDVNGAAIPHSVFSGLMVPGMDLAALTPSRLIAGGRTAAAFHEGDLDNISLSSNFAENSFPIPTLSFWGILAMTLLLLLAGRRFAAEKTS